MTPADIQQAKQRFGIIGNAPGLTRAVSRALQIAPTDLSVLITGESGTGKEFFHKLYIPTVIVNMVAISL